MKQYVVSLLLALGASVTPLHSAAAQPAIDVVPVSEHPLGEFPFFRPPEGYREAADPVINAFDRFGFWVGDEMRWEEGRIYSAGFTSVRGESFSALDFERSLHRLLEQVGAVRVFHGRIPREVLRELDTSMTVTYVDGLGDVYNAPASVYLLRRPDRNIWVHMAVSGGGAGLLVLETEASGSVATLLPAGALGEELSAAGRVRVEVNFASGEAAILEESLPQIEQIVELLAEAPDMRLSVEGHTDSTGDRQSNMTLSSQRAQAVVDALRERGVSPQRLQAIGHGDTRPVADNSSPEGKALNRRVELVAL